MLVILLANLNIEKGLVNGSTGHVIDFKPFNEVPMADPEGGYASIRKAKLDKFKKKAERQVWPVVQFSNGEKATIVADCEISTYGDNKPYVLLSRTQIPLMAGWAITIHRSQVWFSTRASNISILTRNERE